MARFVVTVTRTSVASRDIVVDAPEINTNAEAVQRALNQAGNEDFTGCTVDYEFGVDGVSPNDGTADDEEIDLASEEKRCPDLNGIVNDTPEGVCSVCCTTPFPGVSDETIDLGWTPSYFEGQDECEGPVCPRCNEQFIREVEMEWTLSITGEYVSVWDSGIEIRTPCAVNPKTRECCIDPTRESVEGIKVLHREYVVLNGIEYPACNKEEWSSYSPEEQLQMFWWE